MQHKGWYLAVWREVRKHKIRLRARRTIPIMGRRYEWHFVPRTRHNLGMATWPHFHHTNLRRIVIKNYGWGPDWLVQVHDCTVGDWTNYLVESKNVDCLMDLIIHLANNHKCPIPGKWDRISFVAAKRTNDGVDFSFSEIREHTEHYLKAKPVCRELPPCRDRTDYKCPICEMEEQITRSFLAPRTME